MMMGCTDMYNIVVSNTKIKTKVDRLLTLSWVKTSILSRIMKLINRFVEDLNNWVLKYMLDRPDRVFVCEELTHIPQDTELRLDWVKNCE